jgi:hypothetical protein
MTLGWAIITTGLPHTRLRQWWDDLERIGSASTIMGTGVHVIDLLRFAPGQEVTEVAVSTDGQTAERLPASSLAGQSQLT